MHPIATLGNKRLDTITTETVQQVEDRRRNDQRMARHQPNEVRLMEAARIELLAEAVRAEAK